MKKILLTVAFIVFPWYYLLTIIYHPEIQLLRNTVWNYIVILSVGMCLALLSKHIFMPLNDHAKKIFRQLIIVTLFTYAVALVGITYYCYTHYIFESVDVSYYHLAIWQLANWKLPYIWDMPTTPLWLQHFEPILFFFVPIYWVIRDAGILVIIQALAVVSGAIPIYLSGKNILRSRYIALANAYAYLAFGGLQVGFAYGFHPIMLFPPLFLWMYYWYTRKKFTFYLLFVFLSLLVKEEVSFIMVFWGLYLLLVKKDFRLGLITISMGFVWYILCFGVIIPHFSPKDGFVYWSQYNQAYGNGIQGIITFAIKRPYQFFINLITPSVKIDSFFQIFGAFAFLLFLYPPSLIIIIPSLLEKLLNNDLAALNGTHYTAAITAVTVVATLETLRYIQTKRWASGKKGVYFFGTLIAYVAFFSNVLYGCLTFAIFPFGNIILPPKENLAFLSEVIATIPNDATVGAQYIIAPHMQKPFGKILPWPNVPTGPDFIIYDTKLATVLTIKETINANLDILSKNTDYQLVVNHLGVILFEKIKKE